MRDKIKLVSSAGTGHYYTTDKNKRNTPSHLMQCTNRSVGFGTGSAMTEMRWGFVPPKGYESWIEENS